MLKGIKQYTPEKVVYTSEKRPEDFRLNDCASANQSVRSQRHNPGHNLISHNPKTGLLAMNEFYSNISDYNPGNTSTSVKHKGDILFSLEALKTEL